MFVETHIHIYSSEVLLTNVCCSGFLLSYTRIRSICFICLNSSYLDSQFFDFWFAKQVIVRPGIYEIFELIISRCLLICWSWWRLNAALRWSMFRFLHIEFLFCLAILKILKCIWSQRDSFVDMAILSSMSTMIGVNGVSIMCKNWMLYSSSSGFIAPKFLTHQQGLQTN